jgi:uncharacterized protein
MTSARPSRLEGYRARRDEFMHTSEHSPLTDEQKAAFVPLDYFPEDPGLAFVVEPDTSISKDPVELPTTTGETKSYVPFARVTFEVDGQPVSLTVYREPERGRLILPFRDMTNNIETYGAGRTVDPQERPDGRLSIDFNYTYGPYCQYNDNWVCTIPPMENWLRVPIRAGEKVYPGKESTY